MCRTRASKKARMDKSTTPPILQNTSSDFTGTADSGTSSPSESESSVEASNCDSVLENLEKWYTKLQPLGKDLHYEDLPEDPDDRRRYSDQLWNFSFTVGPKRACKLVWSSSRKRAGSLWHLQWLELTALPLGLLIPGHCALSLVPPLTLDLSPLVSPSRKNFFSLDSGTVRENFAHSARWTSLCNVDKELGPDCTGSPHKPSHHLQRRVRLSFALSLLETWMHRFSRT